MPRCPPPLADELLSSWLKRLARANYCTEDELCRYLGLRSGRAPETLADLAGVDVAGLCSILRLVRDDLVAMLIVEHHNFPIRCVNGGVKTSQVAAQKSATVDMACLSAV